MHTISSLAKVLKAFPESLPQLLELCLIACRLMLYRVRLERMNKIKHGNGQALKPWCHNSCVQHALQACSSHSSIIILAATVPTLSPALRHVSAS
jgi:hypothetical protein